jgi:hypothetical protein
MYAAGEALDVEILHRNPAEAIDENAADPVQVIDVFHKRLEPGVDRMDQNRAPILGHHTKCYLSEKTAPTFLAYRESVMPTAHTIRQVLNATSAVQPATRTKPTHARTAGVRNPPKNEAPRQGTEPCRRSL